jgi:hypothetical protein
MPGFASYDQIINALTTGKGQLFFLTKASATSVIGFLYRLWNAAGNPAAGSEPSPALQGFAPTKDTVGAIPFANPTAPATLHMLSFGAGGATLGSLILYDRLWHAGGISLTSVTTQTFTGVTAPTRHTNGIGNKLALEITTATTGTSAVTITVTYTNTLDQTGRTATFTTPAATQPVNRVHIFNLQAGDVGVKSVQSIILSGSMSAGVANLIMFNDAEIVVVPWFANMFTERDLVLQMANLPRVLDDACLALMVQPSTTSTGIIYGRLQLAEG